MESEVIFRRSGYEYRYRIGIDEEMLPSYRAHLKRAYAEARDRWSSIADARDRRSFILEVRTNFILKKSSPSGDEEIIDSERYSSPILRVNFIRAGWRLSEIEVYRLIINYRMEEYWLPEKEIERIVREAMCFVKRMSVDPRHADLDVIPVVVHMDVCTVQLQGELLKSTLLRLIKPDYLIPFQVWGKSIVLADGTWEEGSFLSEETLAMNLHHRVYLTKLPRERVEDVEKASARMESCLICSEPPTYGTMLTPLACDHVVQKHCGVPNDHVFHSHCIVRWLMNNKTCPVCRLEITMESS